MEERQEGRSGGEEGGGGSGVLGVIDWWWGGAMILRLWTHYNLFILLKMCIELSIDVDQCRVYSK